MADNITSPVPDGTTLATKDIGGVQYQKSLITDQAGADAVGLVTASPAATTILGRLKAIADALAGTLGISATSLPLPTGAATSANQAAVKASIDAGSLAGLAPFPITPGSSALTRPIVALSVATGGTVIYTPTSGGGDVTVTLPAGYFPLPATHIKAGGTAEGLTGW